MDSHYILNWIVSLGLPLVSAAYVYGSLNEKVDDHEKRLNNNHESIDKLFDAQRDVSTLTAKLEGRLDSINETLNRLAVKIDAFIMQERK